MQVKTAASGAIRQWLGSIDEPPPAWDERLSDASGSTPSGRGSRHSADAVLANAVLGDGGEASRRNWTGPAARLLGGARRKKTPRRAGIARGVNCNPDPREADRARSGARAVEETPVSPSAVLRRDRHLRVV